MKSFLLLSNLVFLTSAERFNFRFQSQNESIASFLFLPTGQFNKPYPAVVSSPGFGGVKEILLPEYAEKLAQIGIATLIFDPIGFGESTGKNPLEVNNEEQLQTFSDAIDLLAGDSRFDANRLGAYGISLSGGHTIHTAGTDKRIKAAVALIPHLQIDVAAANDREALLGDIIADVEAKAKGTKRVLIGASGPPGSRAAMTEPGSVEFLTKMQQQAPNYKNLVTANSLLSMAGYDNTEVAKNITCPTLVISASDDTITPGSIIHKVLGNIKSVTIKDYPGTHFGLLGAKKEETIDLMADWFKKYI